MTGHQCGLEFGCARARTEDPSTSHAAAEAVRGSVAAALESRIVSLLKDIQAGLTTHEIAFYLGVEYGSITPRMKPLAKKGLVFNSGSFRVPNGRTKAGIVWMAVK